MTDPMENEGEACTLIGWGWSGCFLTFVVITFATEAGDRSQSYPLFFCPSSNSDWITNVYQFFASIESVL
jgi:hypothetical protein